MSKKKVYIFPPYDAKKKQKNPYVGLVSNAFANNGYTITGSNKKKLNGTFDILNNLSANLYVINWPENLAFRKFALLQAYVYFFCLWFLKLRKKKLVWILHNKKAHYGNSKLADKLINYTAKKADFTVTHAQTGVEYFENKFPGKPVFNFPHPVYTAQPETSSDNVERVNYDVIIWGAVLPYKGIDNFLSFVKNKGFNHPLKLLIAGKCNDEKYTEKLQSVIAGMPNVTWLNRFIEDDELEKLIRSSRSILFTYSSDSIISSGSVIYSLGFGKTIIGPHEGNFKDLKEMGTIATYKNFEDIYWQLESFKQDEKAVATYFENYSWSKFCQFIMSKAGF